MAKPAKLTNDETGSIGSESTELPDNGPGTVAADSGAKIETGNGNDESGSIGAKPETDAPAPPKRKRGRPPGTGAKAQTPRVDKVEAGTTRKPSTKGIQNLAGLYGLLNNTLAARANAPELVIDNSEAQMIAEPLAAVLAKWNIHLDGADNPYLQLGGTMLAVYSMKVMAMRQRIMMQKAMTVPAQAARAESVPPNPSGVQQRQYDFSAASEPQPQSGLN